MNKKLLNEVLNLATSTFEDDDYNIIKTYLFKNKLNDLRLFLMDRLELMEAVFDFDKENEVLKKQVEMCDRMVDVVVELCLLDVPIKVNG